MTWTLSPLLIVVSHRKSRASSRSRVSKPYVLQLAIEGCQSKERSKRVLPHGFRNGDSSVILTTFINVQYQYHCHRLPSAQLLVIHNLK